MDTRQWSLESQPDNPHSNSRIMDTPRVLASYLFLYYKYNDILENILNVKTSFYKIILPSDQTFFPKFYPYLTGKMSENVQMPVNSQNAIYSINRGDWSTSLINGIQFTNYQPLD